VSGSANRTLGSDLIAARILVIDHTAELAGGEVALARLLAATDPERFDVRVLLLAHGPLEKRLRDQGVQVAVIAASEGLTGVGREQAMSTPINLVRNAARTLALLPRIVAAIRGAHADLVVANTLKAAVLTAVAAPLARRPWTWHLHDRIADDYLPQPLVLGMRAIARFGPRMIVANSDASRQTLPAVPDAKIVVAYPGVDVSHLGTAIPRDESECLTFGLLGRIAPTKGQLEFLAAAARVTERYPEARFVVIGDALFNDAPFAQEVRALPESLGIADRVTFTGWVDDPTAAITDLTALVHASPVPEPFGQVLVEAMLAGTPVIGTDAGGVPEILGAASDAEVIDNGVRRTPLGLLVEPCSVAALQNAMIWMIEHSRERAEMATRARSSASERFDIRVSARTTDAAWARALGWSTTRAPEPSVAIVDTNRNHDPKDAVNE
jgi:glycosyltransferase involved in cell wall biosynthesis